MDFASFISQALNQLQPVIGLLVAILIVAVIYLWRDNVRLQKERNEVIEKKDKDLKEIAASKDNALQAMTEKVIELQEKTIVSNEKLSNNISVNTEATKRIDSHLELNQRAMETLVMSVNTVLTSIKNNQN